MVFDWERLRREGRSLGFRIAGFALSLSIFFLSVVFLMCVCVVWVCNIPGMGLGRGVTFAEVVVWRKRWNWWGGISEML